MESRNLSEITSCKIRSNAVLIDDISTIFSTRYERYYELTYDDSNEFNDRYNPPIFLLDQQVIGYISNNQLFDPDSEYGKYNLLVKYFNQQPIGLEDIIPFETIIEGQNTVENFFFLPMLIFVFDRYIKTYISPSGYKET